MKSDRVTVPTSDAAKPAVPAQPGDQVADFELYRKWIQGDAEAVSDVEKKVGYE